MRSFLILGLIAISLGFSACSDSEVSPTPNVNVIEITEEITGSFDQRLSGFLSVLDKGEISRTTDYMPPVVLKSLLKENKVSRDALETQLDALWVQTLETVEIDSMKMDGQFNKIVPLPTGQLYRIIPTEIKMRLKANDSEIVSSSESLAIFEDGDWYFVRLDDANLIKMFHKSYPDFKVVEIMTPTMKIDGQEVAQ